MAEEQGNEQEVKKKLPIKTIIILAVVLLIEGAAISAAFLLTGGPDAVKADGAAMDEMAQMEQPVEELVVADKFQNTKTGKTYIYETEVYVVVKRKNQERVQKTLETMSAQITTGIAIIVRRAEPAHLLEPSLATLNRQIKVTLDDRFKLDDEGKPIVQQVLIKKCTQFPTR